MIPNKEYMPVVAAILNSRPITSVLDTPSGSGWLRGMVDGSVMLDGIDLYDARPEGYRNFRTADLDHGLPDDLPTYDAIVSCEGLEHVGNPELFLRSAAARLNPGGVIVITTPNTWHPAARLQYFTRGFFPGFPSLAGRIEKGTHMHITPWTFPHLYLYLSLVGFKDITLHDIDEPKPRRAYERLLGLFGNAYCSRRQKKAASDEERRFWMQAGSRQSIYGRRLVVSAVKR
jgi:cyclopropane fatty-acyl-phospholipid synthase-like methyltransferase